MLINLITKNRSYRRFDESHSLDKETLKNLIEHARLSPSAANLQNLRFFLSNTNETNELIFPHLSWAGYLRYWDGPEIGQRPSAYIIILSPATSSKYHLIDAGIAAQSILLAATELGLGGCMIASINKEQVHDLLSLPANLEIVFAIALGKPAEEVVIEDVIDPDDIEYWRDDEDVHHVPKWAITDLLIPETED